MNDELRLVGQLASLDCLDLAGPHSAYARQPAGLISRDLQQCGNWRLRAARERRIEGVVCSARNGTDYLGGPWRALCHEHLLAQVELVSSLAPLARLDGGEAGLSGVIWLVDAEDLRHGVG